MIPNPELMQKLESEGVDKILDSLGEERLRAKEQRNKTGKLSREKNKGYIKASGIFRGT